MNLALILMSQAPMILMSQAPMILMSQNISEVI
jgi:hypothetical protein